MMAINFMPQEHNERVRLGHGCGVCSKTFMVFKAICNFFKLGPSTRS